MLRKWRRYERKKRHGIFIRGAMDEETEKRFDSGKLKSSSM